MRRKGAFARVICRSVALFLPAFFAGALSAREGDVCVERFNTAGMLYNDAQLASQNKAKSYAEAARAFEAFIKRATECPDKEKCEAKEKVADGYFYLGASHVEAGKPGDAVAPLKSLKKDFPNYAYIDKAAYLLGKALYDTGEFASAAETFAELSQKPKSELTDVSLFWEGESRYRIAEQWRAQNKDATAKFDEASAVFQKLVANFGSSPRVPDALYSMGWCYLAVKKWKEAGETFQKLTTDKKHKEEALFRSGECAYTLKEYAKSASFHEQAQKIGGRFAGRAALGRGWSLFHQSKFPEASGAFEQAIPLLEKSPVAEETRLADEARLAMGESLERIGGDAEKLRKAVETLAPLAAKKTDISDDALYLTAVAQNRLGMTEEAAKTAATAIEQFPGGNVIAELRLLHGDIASGAAGKARREGRGTDADRLFDDARRSYEAVIANSPSHPGVGSAYQKLVVVLFAGKNHEEAAARCGEFLKKFPDDPQRAFFVFALAENLLAAKRTEEAAKLYGEIAANEKEKQFVPNALYRLAYIARDAKDYNQSAKQFARLAAEFPQNPLAPESAYLAAVTMLDAADYGGARTLFGEFVKKYPNDPQYAHKARINAAVCLARQKKLKEARTEFEEIYNGLLKRGPATARKPQPAVFPDPAPEGTDVLLYELAWVCKDLNDAPGAARCFDQLLDKQFEKSRFRLDAVFESSNAAYEKKEYDETIEKCSRIAAAIAARSGEERTAHDDELLGNALYRVAWCRFKKGAYEEAEKSFADLAEKFPKGRFAAEAGFMSGESAMRATTFAGGRALDHFRSVVERHPDNETYAARSLLRTGDCQGRMNLWEESIKSYETFLGKHPKSEERPAALYGVALACQKLNRIEDAVAGFEKAKSEDGGKSDISPKSQFMIGEIRFQERKFDEAITAYKLVWMRYANAEWSGRALYEAAKAAKELKQWKESASYYERLIKEFPNTPHAAEARKDLPAVQKLIAPK